MLKVLKELNHFAEGDRDKEPSLILIAKAESYGCHMNEGDKSDEASKKLQQAELVFVSGD